MAEALRGKEVEVSSEVLAYWREYQFRKTFGGSHKDFLDQPIVVTEWLTEIENMMNGLSDNA